jgi:hypothetical protein
MKKITLFCFSLISFSLAAQVTLIQSQFPVAGSTFNLNMSDTTGVLPGNSGTNVTWNYNALNSSFGIGIDSFLSVPSTPYGSNYPQSNLALHETAPGTDYFVYYDVNSSWASRVGNADTVNQITYTNPANEFEFPLSYGTTGNDTYTATYSSQSGDVVHVHGTLTGNADGTGTLQLPSSTYTNTLRVHYTRDELDTVFTTSGNYADHLVFNYYLWYINGSYYPILKMNFTFIDLGFTQMYRKYIGWRTPPLGIASAEPANNNLQIFPDPASETIFIQSLPNVPATISLFDATGKLVRSIETTSGNSEMPVSDLTNGLYFLNVNFENGKTETKKIFINN